MRAIALFCVLASVPARADDLLGDAALFAGGAATAFAAHEAGHAAANLLQGNTPHLEQVSFLGAIPFFAVAPDIYCYGRNCIDRNGQRFRGGQRGLLLILLAGFDVQHLTDEALLSAQAKHGSFQTGMLAFNTFTSVAYGLANLAGIEPDAGDLHAAFRDTGAPRAITSGLLLGIAGVDLARWACPGHQWLSGLSRAAKVLFLGMPLAL